MGLRTLLRTFGTMAYETYRYYAKTSVISREDGRTVRRFDTWDDYLKEEHKYPYSKYIIL